ncbi:FISUMP domain-containing protein [Ekhidna sp.]|uniref:FISUMP domain-containing protein n=1 Tax=Ekhidna sp. TaxID=2608089 RepID=UPI003B513138
MKMKYLLSLILLAGYYIISAQEFAELTDSRDGKTYKIVTVDIELEGGVIINRTWMAQNLAYEVPDSFCYKNEPAYCEAFGRLYTFQAAQAACPDGWHVPTISEWNLLFKTFGGIHNAGIALQKGGESGIDLALGGFGDPGRVFKNIGISGNYWDAEKKSDNTSGLISVQKGSKEIYHSVIGDWHRNSCRCIKDYN